MLKLALIGLVLCACASTGGSAKSMPSKPGPAPANAPGVTRETLADGRTRVEERGPHSVLVTVFPAR